MEGARDPRLRSPEQQESHRQQYLSEAIAALEEQRGRPLTDSELQTMNDLAERMAQAGREAGEAVLGRRESSEA